MASASNIAHRGLPFANPMREADVDRALGSLALPPGALVLDTGCGAGEMLLRALERDATWRGLGVDLDPDAIAAARARAAERLPGRDVRFEVRDASDVSGRHDAVLNVGSSHVHGGYPAALRALRGARGERRDRRLRRGLLARAAVRRVPRGARRRDRGRARQPRRPALERPVRGLRHRVAHRGGRGDWAAYEETLAANAERDGGPETAAYAERIRARRALPDGTRTLGFALLVLRAAGPRAGDG